MFIKPGVYFAMLDVTPHARMWAHISSTAPIKFGVRPWPITSADSYWPQFYADIETASAAFDMLNMTSTEDKTAALLARLFQKEIPCPTTPPA
jgi:hypothetical protein